MLGYRGFAVSASPIRKSRKCRPAPSLKPLWKSPEEGFAVVPEIWFPWWPSRRNWTSKAIIDKVAQQVFEEASVDYLVGTMIEIPRAAVTADEIAETAQFFSFGTYDQARAGLGRSRDIPAPFLPQYQELEIIKKNVFASIDQYGVGKLMHCPWNSTAPTRPDIKLGICGERRRPRFRQVLQHAGPDLCEFARPPRPDRPSGRRPRLLWTRNKPFC